MSVASETSNSSRFSYYVTDAFYTELVEDFTNWQRDELLVDASDERDIFRQLLAREARFLDKAQFGEWLDLLDMECAYWVPGTAEAGDPRGEITVTFDDRRRIEDRVFRLRTGFAWSQAPASRTTRQVSNVEVFRSQRDDQRMVRSNFAIHEFWDGETRVLAGWAGHRFRKADQEWKISAKQINLLICDQCIRNPSIIL